MRGLVGVVIDGLLAREHEVNAFLFGNRFQDLGNRQWFQGFVGDDLDCTIGAHRQTVTQGFLGFTTTDRNHDHFLGGTGFIGAQVVRKLREKGHRVAVMARRLGNLPDLFADPEIELVEGDVGSASDLKRAIGPARVVINLAQGAGGGSGEDMAQAMAQSAERIGKAIEEISVY